MRSKNRRAQSIARALAERTPHGIEDVQRYAWLAVMTDTPVAAALDILTECGTIMSATGRLLIEAAERAFRASGDVQ